MTRVNELIPGDIVTLAGITATFITSTTHPLWPHLELVTWWGPGDTWHHDALMAVQDVGRAQPTTHDDRQRALRDAFTPQAFTQEST